MKKFLYILFISSINFIYSQDVISGNSSYTGDNVVSGNNVFVNKKMFFFNTNPPFILNKSNVESETFSTDNDSYITGDRQNIGVNKINCSLCRSKT